MNTGRPASNGRTATICCRWTRPVSHTQPTLTRPETETKTAGPRRSIPAPALIALPAVIGCGGGIHGIALSRQIPMSNRHKPAVILPFFSALTVTY